MTRAGVCRHNKNKVLILKKPLDPSEGFFLCPDGGMVDTAVLNAAAQKREGPIPFRDTKMEGKPGMGAWDGLLSRLSANQRMWIGSTFFHPTTRPST